jgi:hypothetical protein
MTRTELTTTLRANGIHFQAEDDCVFVRFGDAPEGSPKGKLVAKLMKRVIADVSDKGIVFLV